jgi:CheY-like chemotaxis protein
MCRQPEGSNVTHRYETDGLERLLGEVRHLAARGADQEQRLARLAYWLESHGATALPPALSDDMEGEPPAAVDLGSDLTETIRQLCGSAREQRLVAESLCRALLGLAMPGFEATRCRARVLVVDDAPDARELAAIALEVAGFHVSTAGNGLEALFTAHDLRPSVILMDISMPVLDGIEATRLLKAGTTTREAHVIAHTARPGALLESMTRLFSAILPKPALPDLVINSVQRFAGA